jgi:hypothetical protein
MIKRILGMLLATLILSGLTTGLAEASPGWRHYRIDPAMPSSRTIAMCKDWVGDTNYNGCSSDSGDRRSIFDSTNYRCTHRVWNDQWSPCYNNFIDWADTDGFYVSSGYDIGTNVLGVASGWKTWTITGWRKVGDCFCWTLIKKYPQ